MKKKKCGRVEECGIPNVEYLMLHFTIIIGLDTINLSRFAFFNKKNLLFQAVIQAC